MITLEVAYSWLHKFEPSKLSKATSELVGKLNQCVQTPGQNSKCFYGELQQQLDHIRYRLSNSMEVAEICLEFVGSVDHPREPICSRTGWRPACCFPRLPRATGPVITTWGWQNGCKDMRCLR